MDKQHQNDNIITGMAIVIVDPQLSIIASDGNFKAILPKAMSRRSLCDAFSEEEIGLIRKRLKNMPQRVSIDAKDFTSSSSLSVLFIKGNSRKAPQFYHLIVTDTSIMEQLRRQAREERLRYKIALDDTISIFFEYDCAEDTMYFGEPYETTFGRPAIIPHFLHDLRNREFPLDSLETQFKKLLLPGIDTRKTDPLEGIAKIADGSMRWFSLRWSLLQENSAIPTRAVGLLKDIDNQKRERENLLNRSRHDSMTGLLNKTTTEDEIRASLKQLAPGDHCVLMMIDGDSIKSINDTYGHSAGDSVIIEIANHLRQTFRNEDIVGRVGGDEFHVYLPNIDDINIVKNKARELLSSAMTVHVSDSTDVTITLSIGITHAQAPIAYETLFQQADTALYRAKHNGRNCFEIYDGPSATDTDDSGNHRAVSRTKAREPYRLALRYNQALRIIYDEIFELDLTGNRYRTVHQIHDKDVTQPTEGKLEETFPQIIAEKFHPDDREQLRTLINRETLRKLFTQNIEYTTSEFRKLGTDGNFHRNSLTFLPLPPEHSGDEILLVLLRDIEEQTKNEGPSTHNEGLEDHHLADECYRTIVEQTGIMVFEWNRDNNECILSPEIPQRFAGDYDGTRNILTVWCKDHVIHENDLPIFNDFLAALSKKCDHESTCIRLKKRDESSYMWCKITITAIHDPQGHTERFVGTINDVDNAVQILRNLHYQAQVDPKTNICNEQTFHRRMSEILRTKPDIRHHLIIFSIDRLKNINDLYGIREGDRLLREVAEMAMKKTRGHGICGRLEGSSLGMCVDFGKYDCIQLINEISEELAKYPLPCRITAKFGICTVDNPLMDTANICEQAATALRFAQQQQSTSAPWVFYSTELRDKTLRTRQIESDMHEALRSGQFIMGLQPRVDITNGQTTDAEATIHWLHPSRGAVPAEEFMPLFEKNGFIAQIDEYTWEQACYCLRRWLDRNWKPVPIAVNLALLHFYKENFLKKLMTLLQQLDIPPQLLELEMKAADAASFPEIRDKLEKLRDTGFKLGLHGLSGTILTLPKDSMLFDYVRLDSQYLDARTTNQDFTRHVIALLGKLGLKTVVSGVSSEQQVSFLKETGEHIIGQGPLFASSMPWSYFEKATFKEAQD